MHDCLQCGLRVDDPELSSPVDNGRVHDWCLAAYTKRVGGSVSIPAIPLTTGYTTVAGNIVKEIDIVTSECVFGINLFKDMLGGIRDIVGGRAGAHQNVLKDLRKTCLDELRLNAAELGADAVIGVDLDYSEISGRNGGLLFFTAAAAALGPFIMALIGDFFGNVIYGFLFTMVCALLLFGLCLMNQLFKLTHLRLG